MGATVNILDKAKAEELRKLGFNYVEQRIGDNKQVYVFINSPELTKVLTTKFSGKDFYIGKTLNF